MGGVKIISLLPSATEIVYALGLEDDLAGVTFECDYPPGASAKPVISTTSLPSAATSSPSDIDAAVREKVSAGEALYRIDEDAVRRIQPDVILAQDLCRVCAVPSGQVTAALEVLGCDAQVVSLDPSGLDDVIAGIDEVGRATGTGERAARIGARLRARVDAVRATAGALDKGPTLALEWAEPPFLGGHWVPEMIDAAGGRDVLGTPREPSRTTTWEEIAAAAPEVIVFMPCGYDLEGALGHVDELFDNPIFASLPAARRGRVYAVDASSYFSRPGPRIVDGLEILAWVVHPEAFPAPPRGTAERVVR